MLHVLNIILLLMIVGSGIIAHSKRFKIVLDLFNRIKLSLRLMHRHLKSTVLLLLYTFFILFFFLGKPNCSNTDDLGCSSECLIIFIISVNDKR